MIVYVDGRCYHMIKLVESQYKVDKSYFWKTLIFNEKFSCLRLATSETVLKQWFIRFLCCLRVTSYFKFITEFLSLNPWSKNCFLIVKQYVKSKIFWKIYHHLLESVLKRSGVFEVINIKAKTSKWWNASSLLNHGASDIAWEKMISDKFITLRRGYYRSYHPSRKKGMNGNRQLRRKRKTLSFGTGHSRDCRAKK